MSDEPECYIDHVADNPDGPIMWIMRKGQERIAVPRSILEAAIAAAVARGVLKVPVPAADAYRAGWIRGAEYATPASDGDRDIPDGEDEKELALNLEDYLAGTAWKSDAARRVAMEHNLASIPTEYVASKGGPSVSLGSSSAPTMAVTFVGTDGTFPCPAGCEVGLVLDGSNYRRCARCAGFGFLTASEVEPRPSGTVDRPFPPGSMASQWTTGPTWASLNPVASSAPRGIDAASAIATGAYASVEFRAGLNDPTTVERVQAIALAAGEAVEAWLRGVLQAHGVTLEEVPARCVRCVERRPDGSDVMWVEIDGQRVEPMFSLRVAIAEGRA